MALLPVYFFNLFFRKSQLYQKYWERICGSDLTKDLLYYSEAEKVSITIIDLYNPTDSNKVASQAIFSEKLRSTFPELRFDYIIYNPEKKSEILEQIKSSDSKIVFSTLWMKKQEQSVVDIMEYCPNIKLGLWIWSSFDYFIGFQKRAPKIFCSLGLEWFYRIFTWPQKIKRLKRIYNAIFIFLYKVITQ
jgi:exopolysaccharide biosynthesis WecB/TagA/CpsF family protein